MLSPWLSSREETARKLQIADGAVLHVSCRMVSQTVLLRPPPPRFRIIPTNRCLGRSAFWHEIEHYKGADPLEVWIRRALAGRPGPAHLTPVIATNCCSGSAERQRCLDNVSTKDGHQAAVHMSVPHIHATSCAQVHQMVAGQCKHRQPSHRAVAPVGSLHSGAAGYGEVPGRRAVPPCLDTIRARGLKQARVCSHRLHAAAGAMMKLQVTMCHPLTFWGPCRAGRLSAGPSGCVCVPQGANCPCTRPQ